MKHSAAGAFGAQLKALRETAGFTQEELATIAGLSVHAVGALERGERRRPQLETVRALSAALNLTGATRDAFLSSARAPAHHTAVDDVSGVALPLPLTALLGRDTDMKTLRHWLADPAARLITLIGPGGVGKTRLALELARAIAGEGSIRVVFVPLAAVRDASFVAAAIADALGLSDTLALDLPRRARIACRDSPTLLVLDNFEQVLDAAPLVGDLLKSVEPLRVLTTSRAPLRLRGEREYAVGSLALAEEPDAMAPADLARSPAVRLFVERARDVQPDFRLTPANASIVAAICRRLDALPLALELTAPWIKVLSAEDLLRRLEHDVLLSTGVSRDLPERQQTMNATVAWSYKLLDPDEQRAFCRFGALPGLFPIDAAAAVLAGRDGRAAETDDAIRVVVALIDKSLLLRSDTSVVATCPLYQMLETVRAYAALELAAAGERDDAMEGLVRYCLGEASLAAEGLVGVAQVEWLGRVREDLQSYRSALAWLIERGRSAEASAIASALLFFWWIRGHAAEGLQWYEQILSQGPLPPVAESRALLGAAVMWYVQGRLERARTLLTRACSLARASGDPVTAVRTDEMFARVVWALGDLQGARDLFARAIEGYRALQIRWGTGNALIGMSGVAIESGDPGEAEHLLAEATSVVRDAGPWFQSRALLVNAILAVGRGNADDAIALVRESLTRIRDLHDKYALIHALVPLAAAAALKGEDAWAARIMGTGDAVAEHTGATVFIKPAHALRGQAEREVRSRLGPDRWAQAYAAGRTSSIDALIQDIDRACR
jgi:predicted ATPase/transcriptional regulator with XRE-family HTH domain